LAAGKDFSQVIIGDFNTDRAAEVAQSIYKAIFTV
jgi:hypothetical protein